MAASHTTTLRDAPSLRDTQQAARPAETDSTEQEKMSFSIQLGKRTVGQLLTIAQVEGDTPSEIIEDAIVNLMDAYFEQVVRRAA